MSKKSPSKAVPESSGVFAEDAVHSFEFESADIRGRALRFGRLLTDVIARHAYPEQVEGQLAQAVALSALFASLFKFSGIFSLQVQGDGYPRTMLCDVTSAGTVRAYAAYQEEKAAGNGGAPAGSPGNPGKENPGKANLGQGNIVFTVDQADAAERYQGIVALRHGDLLDSVTHYFNQSEQIPTGIRLALYKKGREWRCGAILLQRMPGESGGALDVSASDYEDEWRRAMILLESCTDQELVSEDLPLETLLLRLFHEEGLRVYEPMELKQGCHCSEEKIFSVLRTLSEEDIEHITIEGKITVTCEFCARDYLFEPSEIRH